MDKVNPSEPPPGISSLINHLKCIYPDQPNPLQVTTLLKYWLGGHDPLDYISMYYNKGDPDRDIPPHWHYISFGLSDLHGDGRVHLREKDECNPRSGMGFELTFRLKESELDIKDKSDNANKPRSPPTWPANLLQAIARYCFQSGNRLYVGDNIPWRKSLDNDSSILKNILIAHDAQLSSLETPFGIVDFCQIVGVTEQEIEQATRWNGHGVLNYLREDPKTGGEWLITDINRNLSVFELFPETLSTLEDDLEKQGSDLAGVNADFSFRELQYRENIKQEIDSISLNKQCKSDENNRSQTDVLMKSEDSKFPMSMSLSCNSLDRSCPLDYQPQTPDCISLDGIELTLAPNAAKYLVLAIKDRIRHGRHFTFKALHLAVTFVAESVTGAMVTKSSPYGILGYWIQILISDDLIPRMLDDFKNMNLMSNSEPMEKITFNWPDINLKINIDRPNVIGPNLSDIK